MATLTQITLDADGTIAGEVRHDAGTGSPFYTHCNDAPDGLSSDFVENDDSETTTTAWFSLANVDADFGSMDTLNIDVDVQSTGFSNDTCTLTARIFDADNDTTNALTDESGNLATEADSTRTQRNVSFASLTGSEVQWNAAHIRFTWTYSQVTGPDNANLQLYGLDIDGTYVVLQTGAYFDGTNDWLDASTPSTGDTTEASSVFWFKPATGGDSNGYMLHGDGSRLRISLSGLNGGKYRIGVRLETSAGPAVAVATTNYVFTPDDWNVLFFSYDSVAQTLHLWDATSDVHDGGGTLNTGTIDHTTEHAVGASITGNFKFTGALQCIWLHNEFIDFSSSAERDKFLANNEPNLAAIGADGSGPTGTQPLYWLRDPYDSFETNYGSAPDFTVNGALTDEGTLPAIPVAGRTMGSLAGAGGLAGPGGLAGAGGGIAG